MADKVKFAELLGLYRTRCGWSQGELGMKIGVHRNTIASWESGDRHPQSRGEVLRLADELLLSREERKAFLKEAGFSIEHWPADYWNVPYPRNPYFVGRETVLQSLRQALVPGAKATALTQSISGLGGIGKTQVAIEYAHRYGEYYTAVLWIAADSLEVATAAVLQLAAEVLGLSEQQEAEQQIAQVKRWLQKRHGWLLILDNVENPQEILSTFVPSKHQGSVLITTRRRDVGVLAHNEMLPLLSEEDAILFLLRRAKCIARKASVTEAAADDFFLARDLCQLLDRLPLALDQAGAYIAENGGSLQRYIDLYHQFRPKLLAHRKATDHPDSVLITFWLSWEQIQQRNALAGKALQFCAFLASDQIPEALVLVGITMPAIENMPEMLEMDEALGLLYRYSLVERIEQTLSLHRLVQEVIQDVLSEEERQLWMERAVMVIQTFFPSGKHETWSVCEFLLSHALICTKWIEVLRQKKPIGTQLLRVTGRYLYERAQYKDAELLWKRVLAICEEQLGATHPNTAASLNNLAAIYFQQGKYGEAEPLLKHALVVREEQLGTAHPDTVISLNSLAELYRNQGRYEDAEPLLKRALAICEEQLGAVHPITSLSLNGLAALYLNQKRYEDAEPLLKRALVVREEQSGATHPNTATSLNNLAVLYWNQGRYEDAEPLLKRAFAIHEEQLGATHPNTAASLNNLAELYFQQGKYDEAEPLLKHAFAIHEEQLGATHPNTATSLNNLAELYRSQGRYEDAESLLVRALAICEEQLGTVHPDTAASLNNLAAIYFQQGKYDEAEPLSQHAVALSKASLGIEHPQTQKFMINYLTLLSVKYTNADVDALPRSLRLEEADDKASGEDE